jgi:hypothetical protein
MSFDCHMHATGHYSYGMQDSNMVWYVLPTVVYVQSAFLIL